MKRRKVGWKRVVLEYAAACGSDAKSYREFEIPKSTFYRWKKAYALGGMVALQNKKPIGKRWPSFVSSSLCAIQNCGYRNRADGARRHTREYLVGHQRVEPQTPRRCLA